MERDPSMLGTVPAFGGLTMDTLNFLLDLAQVRTVEAGEYFFREDELGTAVYILEQGTVEISKHSVRGEVFLRTLSVGDCFGEMALLAVVPRSASVKARDRCVAVELTNAHLFKLYGHDLEQFTMLVMNLGREVCRRLYEADKRLFQLVGQSLADDG